VPALARWVALGEGLGVSYSPASIFSKTPSTAMVCTTTPGFIAARRRSVRRECLDHLRVLGDGHPRSTCSQSGSRAGARGSGEAGTPR
jgi:hypothetical protein